MTIHIWCPRASNSALFLRDSIRAKGVRAYKSIKNLEGLRLRRFLRRVRSGDLWVNWGPAALFDVPCQKVLNANTRMNKAGQLRVLIKNSVPTLEISNTPIEGWLGRSLRHQEGRDLSNNSGLDYWTKKKDFVREVRIHIYKGRSIHAGLKVPRVDKPHPWIRSYASGWKIDYSRAKDIRDDRRELAKAAVAALELDFGAVDIGILKDGQPFVIEVNTAPGLDAGASVEVYTKMFLQELT